MNKWKLRELMDKKHINRRMLSSAIGLSEVTLSRRMNGHAEFTLTEIKSIKRAMALTDE